MIGAQQGIFTQAVFKIFAPTLSIPIFSCHPLLWRGAGGEAGLGG